MTVRKNENAKKECPSTKKQKSELTKRSKLATSPVWLEQNQVDRETMHSREWREKQITFKIASHSTKWFILRQKKSTNAALCLESFPPLLPIKPEVTRTQAGHRARGWSVTSTNVITKDE